MNLIVLYLAIGLPVALILYITRLPETESLKRMKKTLAIAHGIQETWGDQLINKVLGPMLAAAFVIVAWPIVIYLRWKNATHFKKMEEALVEEEFHVQPNDLLAQMSIREIELLEMVSDPLGAAPNLPFGHLNPVWGKLKSAIRAGDEIWTFSTRWESKFFNAEIREGYAIVRSLGVGECFVASIKACQENG